MSTTAKIATALTLLAEVQQELLVQPASNTGEKLLTADEVAARVGLKNGQNVRRWPAKGCPHVRAGRLIKYRLSEVTTWLNARRPDAEETILAKATKHHLDRGGFQPSAACSEVLMDRVILRNTVGDSANYSYDPIGIESVRFEPSVDDALTGGSR